VQALHGLVSCAEWTGVKLSTLFEEVGIDPQAEWFLAESADSVSMHRSVPVRKAMDDAMIALYQNGERINPSQGYPMRLLVPGYEGNMNVKWLRRIKVVDGPIMAQNESVAYTILMENGKAWRFFYPQEVKSFITHPSPGLTMKGPGFYEISGLSWSGKGRIGKVEVSADGGKSWALAALQTPVLSKALTRFRMPWNWDGSPAVLLSRATDESGNVQPSRAAFLAERGAPKVTPNVAAFPMEHCNMISSWGVSAKGEVTNQCLRLTSPRPERAFSAAAPSSWPLSRCLPVQARPRPPTGLISGNRSRPPTRPRGTSASGRTASACRPAAAPPPRALSSMRKSAPHVMATRAKARPMHGWSAVRSPARDRWSRRSAATGLMPPWCSTSPAGRCPGRRRNRSPMTKCMR
jgi:hypothetical protein